MNEKINKVKVWIEEHKREIVIAAGAAVVTVGGIILFKNHKEATNVVEALTKSSNDWRPEKLNITDLGVGELGDAMRYSNGTVELWLDNIPLNDMGTLGDAIAAQIPDIPGDNNVWALLSVKPNVVE